MINILQVINMLFQERYILSLLCCCLLQFVMTQSTQETEGRKLFGGYKITPRYCKPSRKVDVPNPGVSICMFNHDCAARQGVVVGACMDGFLFGACCLLPYGSAGELLTSEQSHPTIASNHLESSTPNVDIVSNGFSYATDSITTAHDNQMVQINARPEEFASTPGIIHSSPETDLLNNDNNEIDPIYFKLPQDQTTDRSSTSPSFVPVSLTQSTYQKPMFKPKPNYEDKYVLVPTITHPPKPNKTQELESILNILQMMNDSSTPIPFLSSSKPSTIYMQQTDRKPTKPTPIQLETKSTAFYITTQEKSTTNPFKTTKRPPSTSYVFSTTIPPRRTTQPFKKPVSATITTVSKKTTTPKKPLYAYPTSTFRPTESKPSNTKFGSTSRPSTSYVTGPSHSKRPTTINTHIAGPTYTVIDPSKPNYPSPPPTVIVLSSITSEKPISYEATSQKPKPVTQLTINNILTANNNYHFSTSERPPPTVLITPKPPVNIITGSGYKPPVIVTTDYTTLAELEVETSANDLNNFPPVRNPNLNISASIVNQEDDVDFTTPTFVEDQILNQKVESFVNKIVQSLQGPFQELKDVVYTNNKTALISTTTKKPGTTKKPTKVTSKPTTRKPTTKRPSAVSTKKPTTSATTLITTRKTKPTRKVTTTTPIPQQEEYEEEAASEEELDYRKHCGIRPLIKSGRIVGGKGAAFGEWPWQVLVRESTWLGLFTKNKCGGVLISSKHVITAAHCQPGFLASLVAVFGEYDISGDLESKRSVSKNVKRVIVHRQYDAATFENDLALLELESPVPYDQHIVPICLPRGDEDFTGRMATVTGWGRLKYGGGVPSVLQEVQVPIMENHVCQEMFRTAGHSKVILDSFLCAGYANGQKDSCEGDSGGPLVLQRPDGRWQLAGTVSHGIKCAAPYLPGVYMRTMYYKPWLESITGVH